MEIRDMITAMLAGRVFTYLGRWVFFRVFHKDGPWVFQYPGEDTQPLDWEWFMVEDNYKKFSLKPEPTPRAMTPYEALNWAVSKDALGYVVRESGGAWCSPQSFRFYLEMGNYERAPMTPTGPGTSEKFEVPV